MNIIITGSSGFIGRYFVKKYSDLYNIKTFSFRNDALDNLDCNDIDVVFHLSALVHQMGGADKEEYERINVTQTIQLAQKAKESGVKQFVFMSSIKVYGEETDAIYDENSICNPRDEYGKSKLKAENELQKLENNEFQVTIIRTPIVYGYGVKANLKALINVIKKFPVLPFSNIKNKRSMVYIGNLCSLVHLIIEKKKSGIYIASDDRSLSTSELITIIARIMNKKVFLIYLPFFELLFKLIKPTFHSRLFASLEVDNTLTQKKLDFKNPYSIEEGISFMLNGEVN